MAWLLDLPSWEQDQIYENSPANAFGLVPPFVPDIGVGGSPAMAANYEAPLNPSINDAHPLGHRRLSQQSYRVMSLSAPHPRAPITPSLPDPVTGIISDPHPTVSQPPIVPASGHRGPRPQARKKKSSRVTEYVIIPTSAQSSHKLVLQHISPLFSSYTHPRSPATFECKWEGCQYSGSFKREHELLRHLRTIHIAPLAHSCPAIGCDKVCNREDNLLKHIQNRHGPWCELAAQQEKVPGTIDSRECLAGITGTNKRR